MESHKPFRIFLLVLILSLSSKYVFGQVKIGNNPQALDPASLLELESTSKVFVVNRLTTAQMESVSPLSGAIVYNTDSNCLFYFDGSEWINICESNTNNSGLSIIDNGDGSFTVDNGVDPPFSFNGSNETITTISINGDNTFTYTNELGDTTIVDLGDTPAVITSTLIDNGDGTYTYTDEEGNETSFDLSGNNGSIVSTLIDNNDGTFTYTDETGVQTILDLNNAGGPTTISTLVANGDGTYTYTDENNDQTTFDVSQGGTPVLSTLIDNGDNTFTYTDEDNNQTTFDLGNSASVSTLVDNGNSTYTYTDELGVQTTFFIDNEDDRHFGQSGSVFFANNTTGEPTEDNNNLFWDNTNKRLGVGISTPLSTLHVNGIARTLRIGNGTGTASFPGYHFSSFFNTGMFAVANGALGFSSAGGEVMRITQNQRVGIEVAVPLATLHVGGDLRVDGVITTPTGTYKRVEETKANSIRRLINAKELIEANDKTLLITATVNQLVLSTPSDDNKGTLYILKNLGDNLIRLNIPYLNSSGRSMSSLPNRSVVWLQSDGFNWHQVN